MNGMRRNRSKIAEVKLATKISEPKIKFKELSAGEITQEAIRQLEDRGAFMWRQNNITVPGRKFTGLYGLSDAIGFMLHGNTCTWVASETKTRGDHLSEAQINFLNLITACGGHAFIAEQVGNKVELIPWMIITGL